MATLKEIQSYCQNKTICLVGNSAETTSGSKGEFIDSHDIVVRINGGVPIPSLYEHMGRKSNIWVVSSVSHKIGSVIDLHNIMQPDYILRLRCILEFRPKELYKKTYFAWEFNQKEQQDEDYLELKEILGKHPTTGCAAFHFFKKHIDYKELNIVGFDFFETKTNPVLGSHYVEKRYNHDAEKQYIMSHYDNNHE